MDMIVQMKKCIKRHIPDSIFLRYVFWRVMGHRLNLSNPQTFNEKLQWLKLHDRKPIYTTMVDKYEAKKYVASKIGEQYIIPTLGVWDRFDDIDFDKLPNQFVLKCTHDSGGLVVVKDKSQLDINAARKKINASLKRNFYYVGREWPYKNVKPRIIAEKYMTDDSRQKLLDEELTDYKLMCFGGKVRCTFTCTERFTNGLHVTFFDNDWNVLPFERHYPKSEKPIAKPKSFAKMKELAEKLSKNIPFVRVDFYDVAGDIYFGELTFFPGSGFEEFNPEEWDYKLGKLIKLSENSGGVLGYLIEGEGFCLWLHADFTQDKPSQEQRDTGLTDYKFFCFNGKVRYTLACTERFSVKGVKMTFFDNNWKLLPFEHDAPRSTEAIPKPENFSEMKVLAEKLAKGITFVRVDFYDIAGKIYFGELTFFPAGGFGKFKPDSWDYKIGSWLQLPQKNG